MSFLGIFISIAICLVCEQKIKLHFKKENITDKFDHASMFFINIFYFYLLDHEEKITDERTLTQIKIYKFVLKVLLSSIALFAICFISRAITI